MDTNDQDDETRMTRLLWSQRPTARMANKKCRMTINRFREVLGMRARPRVALGGAAPIESDTKTHRTPEGCCARKELDRSPQRRAGGHVNRKNDETNPD